MGPAGPGKVVNPMGVGELNVVTYEAEGLGDRSYLVHDGHHALVVDPQRRTEPYRATAAGLGVNVGWVLETHIHNDYLSGGLALSRATGAGYGVPAGETVGFASEARSLDEGDELTVGALSVKVLATPGHTPHHLSYWVRDASGHGAVLTGGSLLSGSTGRTDLAGPEHSLALSEAQWRSVRRLFSELPTAAVVLPTHGFGSFCSAGQAPGGGGPLTIGEEWLMSPAARLGLAQFIDSLLADPLPVPSYYRHMGPRNLTGVAGPQDIPARQLAPGSLGALRSAGAALVDLRPRRDFAGAHLRGALNLELDSNLITYLGWMVDFGASLVLISPDAQAVADARQLLCSIGREEVEGWSSPDFVAGLAAEARGHYPVARFAQLTSRLSKGAPPMVVDVRFPHERRAAHIAGSVSAPLPEIGRVMKGLKPGAEVWVHCASGYRAAVAASWLSGRGLKPVLVDDVFENAAEAGLPVVGEGGEAA
jgi:hydroxyacylglutathione hydrolase